MKQLTLKKKLISREEAHYSKVGNIHINKAIYLEIKLLMLSMFMINFKKILMDSYKRSKLNKLFNFLDRIQLAKKLIFYLKK